MTKTDVIERGKKKVLVFCDAEDTQDAIDRVVFLGNLGYEAGVETLTMEVPDPDDESAMLLNLETVRKLCEIREKDDCTVFIASMSLMPYFDFFNIRYVKSFGSFVEECPMRVICMGDVTKGEFTKYIGEEYKIEQLAYGLQNIAEVFSGMLFAKKERRPHNADTKHN